MDSLLETVTALASARTLDEVIRIVRSSARELIAQTAQPASLDNDRRLLFDILQKPSSPQDLLEALSQALASAGPPHTEAHC